MTFGRVLPAARMLFLGIPAEEADFVRRGFHCENSQTRRHLEETSRVFLRGYNSVMAAGSATRLADELQDVALERHGFAFEGAAMALAILDILTPWSRNRVSEFLSGAGARHIYMVHVGIGWALARLRRRVEPMLMRLDPLLGWLAVDGYGFHEGYFRANYYVTGKAPPPKHLTSYACHVFDQGLGRCLWFVSGADADLLPRVIVEFPLRRRADLWSGVGLASAYAGGVSQQVLESLYSLAGCYRPELAQGAVFAAKVRALAGNPALHTDIACHVFTGHTSDVAVTLADSALEGLPMNKRPTDYDDWRRQIQANFVSQGRIA